tara:strand:+ start:512 stop:1594 length:1083 start_codon:yes stop_codon:yes gene_type:complete
MSTTRKIPDHARSILNRLLVGYTDANGIKHEGLESSFNSIQKHRDNSAELFKQLQEMVGQDQLNASLPIIQGKLRDFEGIAKAYVGVIQRLRDSTGMKEAYDLLSTEFTELSQWRALLYSAIRANIAYDRKRETISRADELTNAIAQQAEKLADNIRKLEAMNLHGLYHPLSDIQYLLSISEVSETSRDRIKRWNEEKDPFLAQTSSDIPFEEKHSHYFPDSQRFLSPKDSPGHDLMADTLQELTKPVYRALAQYALANAPSGTVWAIAPDLPELLTALAQASKEYRPKYLGMVGEATSSRQRNPHTQYVRAFVYILQHDYGIELTMPIKRAIPVVANVVINDENTNTSYENLRKLLSEH